MTEHSIPVCDDGAFDPVALDVFLDEVDHLPDTEVARMLGVETHRVIYARGAGRELLRRKARRHGSGKMPKANNSDRARQAAIMDAIQIGHAKGLTQKEIGEAMKIATPTIGHYARQMGLTFKRGGWGRSR